MTLSIVIPAFNESKRLPKTLSTLKSLIQSNELATFKIQEIIIVDDGSQDNTCEIAQSYNSSFLPILTIRSPSNYGKGHAVRTGLSRAKSELCLVADADMSTPWIELKKLFSRMSPDYTIAIGSRDLPESDIKTKQSFLREHLGKSFNILVRCLTNLHFKDTQCGFKLMNLNKIKKLIPELKVNRFAWDVEFLYKAQQIGCKIVEVPVEWAHVEESRVHPIKDGLQMVWTVIKIRLGLI